MTRTPLSRSKGQRSRLPGRIGWLYWQANMDIEIVTDPDACMMYIVSTLAGLGGDILWRPPACSLLLLFSVHQHKAAGVKTKQSVKQLLRRLLIRCSLCWVRRSHFPAAGLWTGVEKERLFLWFPGWWPWCASDMDRVTFCDPVIQWPGEHSNPVKRSRNTVTRWTGSVSAE